jgi:hypothetical protein
MAPDRAVGDRTVVVDADVSGGLKELLYRYY